MGLIIKATYVVKILIAGKIKTGGFTGGEFIKQYTESMTGIICPDLKRKVFLKTTGHQTITQ